MTPKEAALQALLAVFTTAATGVGKAIPLPQRNRDVAKVWDFVTAGGEALKSSLTLRDGTSRVTDELIGLTGDVYDIERRAELEWVVSHYDQDIRDTAFDAGIEAIAAALDALAESPGLPRQITLATDPMRTANVRIAESQDSDLVFDAATQIKAALLFVQLDYASPLPF